MYEQALTLHINNMMNLLRNPEEIKAVLAFLEVFERRLCEFHASLSTRMLDLVHLNVVQSHLLLGLKIYNLGHSGLVQALDV